MLKINIRNLKEESYTYDFVVSPVDIDFVADDAELTDDIKVKVNLYKTGNQITLKTDVSGKFKFLCDRCLEGYVYDFDRSFDTIYKYDFNDDNNEEEVNDDIKYISVNTSFIDLEPDIRDYVLLSIPMRRIPGDVNEICSFCGRDISQILDLKKPAEINPVWEKLIKAKIK